MLQRTWEGEENLVDGVTMDTFRKALEDPETMSATLHKPGAVVRDFGAGPPQYFVIGEGGQWIKCDDLEQANTRSREILAGLAVDAELQGAIEIMHRKVQAEIDRIVLNAPEDKGSLPFLYELHALTGPEKTTEGP